MTGLITPIAALGRRFGLLQQLAFMSRNGLRKTMTGAGFIIEHEWQPRKGAAVFIIAPKP
jgi:hypothetical protein